MQARAIGAEPLAAPAGFRSTSPAMRSVEEAIGELARVGTPILLIGETGTGKLNGARRIHERSANAAQEFCHIACGTLTPARFGANGRGCWTKEAGTVYLSELNHLSAPCQNLLREAIAFGDASGDLPRFISSASQPMDEEVAAGRFREDLLFRLNGLSLRLPPLRHRQQDILPLAEHFLDLAAETYGRPRPILSASARQTLLEYAWPGNMRELEKVMSALVVLADEAAALADLHPRPRAVAAADSVSLKDAARAASREAEKELILKVLTKTRWNRRRAAEYLQISYKALLYKLKQIGAEDSQTS